jgi:arginyl-tRNA synthetase
LCAAVTALGHAANAIETRLIQFVALMEEGKRLKMSTRAGEFIPLTTLVDKVGCDAARYFYVSRKNDQHLDFDLQLAVEKSGSNPVYYAQYAHARADSILRKWGGTPTVLTSADASLLADDAAAVMLCEQLAAFPGVVAHAARERVTHLLTVFIQDLATAMHNYYEKTRILSGTEDDLMRSRLALVDAARQVLASALGLLGVSAPTRM